jgi:hypothetical protein
MLRSKLVLPDVGIPHLWTQVQSMTQSSPLLVSFLLLLRCQGAIACGSCVAPDAPLSTWRRRHMSLLPPQSG